jgi:hypothetical protein
MSDSTRVIAFEVPGTSVRVYYERAETGRLLRLWCDERVYFAEDGSGERTYGEGLARVRELRIGSTLTRHVRAAGTTWLEEYCFDEVGRPVHIDGVDLERDAKHRVVACRGTEGAWLYGYAGDHLSIVDTPHGTRRITRGAEGRPVAIRNGSGPEPIAYDRDGRRMDVPEPPRSWYRDPVGRLWTIAGDDGRPRTTFLWDGFSCLGRIDGAVGAPLAACFSVDPTFTPVRIITKDGVTRVPRDAFGESLLAYDGVPGLHGGTIHDGFVHYRARAADVRTGSFDRRDPLHGGDDDPRRAEGFDGELLVETPACGPYAIAQYDPAGRIDPTGEISVALLFSTFTWSWQHNVAGWLAFDMTFGLIFDLIVSIGQLFMLIGGNPGEAYIKRYFDYEGLYNERTGYWGVRRGFLNNGRAFTYHHMVVSNHESFEVLDTINALIPAPATQFTPRLDGTILRADLSGGGTFLLRGNRDPVLPDWTRSGGAPAAVAPGSPTVWFPSGGIHFTGGTTTVQVPASPTCTVSELVPMAAAPIQAAAASALLVTTVPAGTVIAAGDRVLLTDGAGLADIKTVAQAAASPPGGGIAVTFAEPGVVVAAAGIRLRGLSAAPASTETLAQLAIPPAPASGRMSLAGTAAAYPVGNALQLSQGGTVVGSVLITALEAQITVDGVLPAAFGNLTRIEPVPAPGSLSNAATLAAATSALTGTIPAASTLIALRGNGITLGAFVVSNDGTTAVLDRTPAALTPLGANVNWANLPAFATSIGSASNPGPGSVITYTPALIRTVPAPIANYVILRGTGTNVTARLVTAAGYDALVIGAPLPGNPANPYSAAQFAFRTPPDVPGLALTRSQALTLPPGVTIPAGATALQMIDIGTPAVTAGPNLITNAVVVGSTLIGPAFANLAAAAFVRNVAPSQLVVMSNGTAVELNVVQRIRAFFTLDRPVNVVAGGLPEISFVALNTVGINYNATIIGPATVVALPAAAGATNVQMPRFNIGNLVMVTPGGAAAVACRITAVSGTTLTLTDLPANLPLGPATVQLLVPVAPGAGINGAGPGNGAWRVGHRGATNGGSGPVSTTILLGEVWNVGHVAVGAPLAIVQGTTTSVAAVLAIAFQVDLLVPPTIPGGAGGAMNVTAPAGPRVNTYATIFAQSGTTLVIPLNGPAASANVIAVIPHALPAAGPGVVPVTATLLTSSGTVRVPDDAEAWEIDRRKSLVFHELTHTRHSAEWGPLFMGLLPLFMIEGAGELFTDSGLPEYSAYVAATVKMVNSLWFLEIPSPGSVAFATGDEVQVTGANVTSRMMRLGAKTENRYQIERDAAIDDNTAVQVRRHQGQGGWATALRWINDIGKFLTPGGLTNFLFGHTWGQLIRWILDLKYVITNRLFKGGETYDATLQSARTFQMANDSGRQGIQGFQRVFVTKDGTSTLVNVTGIENDVVTVGQDIADGTGAITVRPYDSGERIDGLDYWNATVPDTAQPARIRIAARANGSKLSLDPFDRVAVAAGMQNARTNVTAIVDDTTFDLQDPPPTSGTDRELRIAYIGENDPVGSLDNRFLNEMGVGWLRWITDPYSQLQFVPDVRATGGARVAWEIFARSLRYAFSSRSFMALLPPGYLFLDDLFKNWGWCGANGGWESTMEQEASQESGDPYSALGKLRLGFANLSTATATVGDLAHYWFTPDWASGAIPQEIVNVANLQDTPGVNLGVNLVVVPTSPNDIPSPTLINSGMAPTLPNPGRCVPDLFFTKTAAAPHATTTAVGADTTGFVPSAFGTIPMTPTLELSQGMYVGFNQQGQHRVTVFDAVRNAARSRQAFNAGKQTIFFDITVNDVAVTVATAAVPAPPATGALQIVTLVLAQPAVVSVIGVATGGSWSLTVTQPGTILAVAGLTLTAGLTTGTEFVELSRLYGVTGNPPVYVDSVLATYGTNSPVAVPVDVSVRLFQVNVIATLTMSLTMTVAAPAVQNWSPGQNGFVLVPASVRVALALATPGGVTYPVGTPPIAQNPAPQIVNVTPIPASLQAFIGGGSIFAVTFPANDPPEAPATLNYTVGVGTSTAPGTLTLQVTLNPIFTLTGPNAVTNGGASITLTSSDGTQLATPTVRVGNAADLTIAVSGASLNITAPPGANPGLHQIIVGDTANPNRFAAFTLNVL